MRDDGNTRDVDREIFNAIYECLERLVHLLALVLYEKSDIFEGLAVGVGRALSQEMFALALEAGLEKIVAQMTVDQVGAIGVFEGLGFRAEALLREHVKDREGRRHDIVVLAHDVAEALARVQAYGLGAVPSA